MLRMTQAQRHRGPDAEGHFIDACAALGHRRLSIIDLSADGNQPMWDASGRYGIVYNGELYNYRALKAELPAYPFKSQSDTEVILAAFAHWGIEAFRRLNGMFALALYDRLERRLYLVRDRFGVKPLYYVWKNGVLAVASEMRALLAGGFAEKKLSRSAVADYLANGAVTGVQRMLQDVQQLPAGCFARIDAQGMHTQAFYLLPEANCEPSGDGPAQTEVRVLELLRQSVARQMASDVPLGAFLSGGIDSSALVALLAELSSEPPLTFTIGFKEQQFDETGFAETIARTYGTRHTTLTLQAGDFLDQLPAALDAMDTPTLDGLNTFVVSKLTRQAGVTVALSGLGGDELFAGYGTFRRYVAQSELLWWRLPQRLRRLATALPQVFAQTPKTRRILDLLNIPAFELEQVYPIYRAIFDPKSIQKMMAGDQNAGNPVQNWLHAQRKNVEKFPRLSQYSLGELSGYTQHMLLRDTDQMSMASSLEVRVPFFDNELVEYLLRVPDALKYPHTPKRLLVRALGNRLPASIVNRPKMGFTLPWEKWLRHELKHFCEDHFSGLAERGILHPETLKRLWTSFHRGRQGVLWSQVWLFVVLEYWLRRNIEG